MLVRLRKLPGSLALILLFFPRLSEAQSEEKMVLAVVQRFFDADAAKDVEGVREVMIPEGRFFSVRTEDDQKVVRSFTIKEYLDELRSISTSSRRARRQCANGCGSRRC